MPVQHFIKVLRDGRKAAELCIECGSPSYGKTRCGACREKGAAVTRRRREEGKIPRPTPEKTSEYNKRHYEKITSKGKCVSCSVNVVEGRKRCDSCADKARASNKKRKDRYESEGRCRNCGGEAELSCRTLRGKVRGRYCKCCWFKVIAGYTLGSSKKWKVLVEKLDACGWRCPYTNEPLVLGDNLSFDHMNPVCRFPERKHDPDNIEPISWQINLMKRDLTKQEFLAVVGRIYDHCNTGAKNG